jgi:hypothetical protein
MSDMIVTGIASYYSDYSVSPSNGYYKVSLLELDNSGVANGFEVELDATSSVSLSISKSLMQHSAESQKVYMDGAKMNPNKMTINSVVSASKIPQIERLAGIDKAVLVSMFHVFGGSVGGDSDIVPASTAGDIGDSLIAYVPMGTPYVVRSLSIEDDGFKNTVNVSFDLEELVLFEFDVVDTYKYGVKESSKIQNTTIKEEPEVREEAYGWGVLNG